MIKKIIQWIKRSDNKSELVGISAESKLPCDKKIDLVRPSSKNLFEISTIETKKKVFVIGMSKTGTSSMEALLQKLEYRVCNGYWGNQNTNFLCAAYYYNDESEIINITKYYDGFADAPWGGTQLYQKLTEIYPDAYFILTTRDTDKWYKSFINMYEQFDTNMKTTMETTRSFGAYGNYLFFKKIFKIDNLEGNDVKIKKYFNNYNNEVELFFKNKKLNFLSIDLTEIDFDVTTITKFIQKDSTKVILPHVNVGVY